jgi:hypothetical protein
MYMYSPSAVRDQDECFSFKELQIHETSEEGPKRKHL